MPSFLDDISEDLEVHLDESDKAVNDVPIVDLETFLYDKDYLNIPFIVSPKQLEFLKATDDNFEDVNANPSMYSELFLLWGKGCLTKDSTICNNRGDSFTIEELIKSNEAITSIGYDELTKELKETNLSVPWCKGEEQLYKVELEDGKFIEVTAGHKFYTKEGWKELRELNSGDEILSWE